MTTVDALSNATQLSPAEFAGIAQHDLFAPLRAGAIYASVLARTLQAVHGRPEPSGAVTNHAAPDLAARLAQRFDDALQRASLLASLFTSQPPPEPKMVDLHRVLARAQSSLTPPDDALEPAALGSIPLVRGWDVPFQSVFATALSRQADEPGSVSWSASTTEGDAAEGRVTVEILHRAGAMTGTTGDTVDQLNRRILELAGGGHDWGELGGRPVERMHFVCGAPTPPDLEPPGKTPASAIDESYDAATNALLRAQVAYIAAVEVTDAATDLQLIAEQAHGALDEVHLSDSTIKQCTAEIDTALNHARSVAQGFHEQARPVTDSPRRYASAASATKNVCGTAPSADGAMPQRF